MNTEKMYDVANDTPILECVVCNGDYIDYHGLKLDEQDVCEYCYEEETK